MLSVMFCDVGDFGHLENEDDSVCRSIIQGTANKAAVALQIASHLHLKTVVPTNVAARQASGANDRSGLLLLYPLRQERTAGSVFSEISWVCV
jgi:hypothetical protein